MTAPDNLPEDLRSLSPEVPLAIRDRSKTDKLYLANVVLNYDFDADVHGELFDTLPQWDPVKTWAEQAESKKRLILWPRGH